MKRSISLGAGLFSCGVVALLWTGTAQTGWEQKNAQLRAELDKAGAAAAARESAVAPHTLDEESRSELARLRSEVRQLRDQHRESVGWQAENGRLSNVIAALPIAPRLADLPGFQARTSWTHQGLLTPEGTLQSFFRAIRDRDIDQITRCLKEEEGRQMRAQLAKDSESNRTQFLHELLAITSGTGYRVTEQQTNPDGTVTLSLQLAAGGDIFDSILRQEGNEWKMEVIAAPHKK